MRSAARSRDAPKLIQTFVPYGDMLNHSNKHPNCKLEINPAAQTVEVVTVAPVRPGDELTMRYLVPVRSSLQRRVMLVSRYGEGECDC